MEHNNLADLGRALSEACQKNLVNIESSGILKAGENLSKIFEEFRMTSIIPNMEKIIKVTEGFDEMVKNITSQLDINGIRDLLPKNNLNMDGKTFSTQVGVPTYNYLKSTYDIEPVVYYNINDPINWN